MAINIRLNGAPVQAEEGETIMEVADRTGTYVPRICKHPKLRPIGRCRLCSVELQRDGSSRLVRSCNYRLRDRDEGLVVLTESDEVSGRRQEVLGGMLSRWPNVPLLTELAERLGVTRPPVRHPQVHHSPTACIRCGICVAACREIKQQVDIIVWTGKGDDARVAMPGDRMNPHCLGCGVCAMACPVGAIRFEASPNLEADFDRVRKVAWAHTWEVLTLDPKQNEMSTIGTTHLVPIMNDHDCLPVNNFQFGCDERAAGLDKEAFRERFDKGFDGCWAGCAIACSHGVANFVLKTGPYRGRAVFVDGPEYETIAGCGSNCGIFDPDAVLEINFYCDTYGLDTISAGTGMAFVMECFERGLITAEHTGGIALPFGAAGGFLEVLHQLARGEGFGRIFGLGVRRMKEVFEREFGADRKTMDDIGMEAKGLEFSEYMTKESLAQQGGYGLALKGPQHDEAWLIFLDMVHNYMPTFEDKAEALHWFPMWRTWFSLNGLCKLPWNDVVPEDNARAPEPAKVMEHVRNYAEFFSGTTGIEAGPDDLIRQSERVYNFQRVFNLRLGYGRRAHDTIPYRSQGPVTEEEYLSREERYDRQLREKYGVAPFGKTTAEKLAFLRKNREEMYEKLTDAVYKRRGWTRDGVPTLEKVRELGIDFPDVVELIAKHQ
jgi:aldehyde:ferredoxin oxidoreductase